MGSKILEEIFGVCGGVVYIINDMDVKVRFCLLLFEYLDCRS